MALPPNAIAIVELVDARAAQASVTPLAQDRIAPAGQVPIRFGLVADGASIDTAGAYGLRARIEDGAGRVLFSTAEPIRVTPWSASTVEILLYAAAPPPDSAQSARPPESADPWLRARAAGVDVRAIGQEPGWTLELFEGDRIVLVSDYGARTESFPWSSGSPFTGGVRYVASGERTIEVTVEDRRCTDVMSGDSFALTVTVVAPPDTLRGCGRRLNGPGSPR
jgi:uncharacterized membrane protein